jgi:hypothetical protein
MKSPNDEESSTLEKEKGKINSESTLSRSITFLNTPSRVTRVTDSSFF